MAFSKSIQRAALCTLLLSVYDDDAYIQEAVIGHFNTLPYYHLVLLSNFHVS